MRLRARAACWLPAPHAAARHRACAARKRGARGTPALPHTCRIASRSSRLSTLASSTSPHGQRQMKCGIRRAAATAAAALPCARGRAPCAGRVGGGVGGGATARAPRAQAGAPRGACCGRFAAAARAPPPPAVNATGSAGRPRPRPPAPRGLRLWPAAARVSRVLPVAGGPPIMRVRLLTRSPRRATAPRGPCRRRGDAGSACRRLHRSPGRQGPRLLQLQLPAPAASSRCGLPGARTRLGLL